MSGDNVLFLDIDGVILPGRVLHSPANAACLVRAKRDGLGLVETVLSLTFDADAIGYINDICRQTNARLVLSSDWRYRVGFEATREKLYREGLDDRHWHDHWDLPGIDGSSKGADIARWLPQHRPSRFVILDDDELAGGFPQVRPDYETGLMEAHCRTAISILTA
jgi:hypothetical protein